MGDEANNELICLSNMENLNAVFINDGMLQSERLIKLNKIAITADADTGRYRWKASVAIIQLTKK